MCIRDSNLAFYKIDEFVNYKFFVWSVSIASSIGLMILMTHLALTLELKTLLLVLASIGAISLGTLMPGTNVSDMSKFIAESLPPSLTDHFNFVIATLYRNSGYISSGHSISKVGHFLTFLMLGIIFSLARAKYSTLFVIAFILYGALATEAFQSLMLARSPTLTDFFVDSMSGILGLLLASTCQLLLKRQKIKHKPLDKPDI